METVGRIGSFISRGVYTVSGPFHPFGGAVDIVVVQQQDGSFKSSPWYVRFGKFQGVLKTKNKEKVVSISVNGEGANFNMYLDRKGEAYFLRGVDAEEEGSVNYTSTSSGDETDNGNQVNKRRFKSKSCNFDLEKPSSVAQIDVNNRKIVCRTNSRRSRLLGLVFGRRSIKGSIDYQEEAGTACLSRIDSLERAQIAADLLELRWSTDLAGKPYRKTWDSSSLKRDNSDRELEVIYDKVVESETIVLDENLLQGEAITEVSTRIDFAEDTACDRNVEEVISDSIGKQLSAEEVSDASTVDIQSHEISEEISAGEVQSRVYCKTSNGSLVGINCSSEQAREVLYLENEGCGEVNVNAKALHVTAVSLPEVIETEEVRGIHSQQTDCSCSGVSKYSFPDVENTPTSPKQDLVHSLRDKIESNCVAITSSYVSLGNQTLDENNATDEDVSASRPPSTSSEEEQFLFSDLDECRINDQCKGSISIEYEDKGDSLSNVDGVEKANQLVDADSNFLLSPENSITEDQMTDLERIRITSSPLLISGNKVVEEDVGQLTGSLPNISSHINGLGQYPISCSLDSKPTSLMLTFVNDASNCLTEGGGNKNQLLHEESGAKDNSSSGDCRSTIVNPSVGDPATLGPSPSGHWRLWPFSSKRSRSGTAMLPAPSDDQNSTCGNASESRVSTDADKEKLKPKLVKKKVRANTPTSEQLESLHLEEGRNTVTFTFSTAMLGEQQVDAQIYLWKWNTRIVISDVDGTITRSDVLGQFMPLVGIDWSQTGVAHLFSAIKENGYQLLFLSARAISQAYHTRRFLFNLKQDGKVLPDGPVVISPDGLFPSLYREVIRRAPHEFKIPCLEDIKALFPSDRNPFYAGFGNRDTDEFSYLKVGIPKGKIFTINPKGEVAVNRRLDTKSYTSLHALVNGMFPPMNSSEQEDYNSWNFWKLPPPSIDI